MGLMTSIREYGELIRLQQAGEFGQGLGLDQPALVVPRLGPGIGEQHEHAVETGVGHPRHQLAYVIVVDADVPQPRLVDVPQGTAALELLEEVPELDLVVTPLGGGGLLSFGLVGIFVGPVLLAVAYTLIDAWVMESVPADADDQRGG